MEVLDTYIGVIFGFYIYKSQLKYILFFVSVIITS